MASKNIFKSLLHPTNNISRNGFDLSHRKVFSAKAGELLPILCEDVVPGDYFEIDTASLIRTLPLNTAAFLRANACFDFYFVPKTRVWSRYGSFIAQRDNYESSALQSYLYEPNITLGTLNGIVNYVPSTQIVDSQDARAKLLELLGYGDGLKNLPTGLDSSKSLTALPICAYNAIYNDFYRNAWRDEPTGVDVYHANLDSLPCSSYATSLVGYGSATYDFVSMKYHGWFKDMYMGSLPNSQFGVVSSVAVDSDFSRLQSRSGSPGNNGVLSIDPTGDFVVRGGIDTSGSVGQVLPSANAELKFVDPSHFDVLALRKALALQKWKEYNMRAGWKRKYQQQAMFGVDAPSDAYHEIIQIGSYAQPINIDEVISTSNTSSPSSGNGNLGEIAGKGIAGVNGEHITFNVTLDGYIFCIFYIMPQAEYDADMIDRNLIRSEPFDHYTPAFANLGMQAIHKHELTYKGNPSVFDNVIGYAPNYYEYKTRTDKVYGAFRTNQAMSPWVSVRRDLQGIVNSGSIPTSYFYVNPSVLDSIFVANADPTLDTDQFMVNCNFAISAVRPMSVLGLPEF